MRSITPPVSIAAAMLSAPAESVVSVPANSPWCTPAGVRARAFDGGPLIPDAKPPPLAPAIAVRGRAVPVRPTTRTVLRATLARVCLAFGPFV